MRVIIEQCDDGRSQSIMDRVAAGVKARGVTCSRWRLGDEPSCDANVVVLWSPLSPAYVPMQSICAKHGVPVVSVEPSMLSSGWVTLSDEGPYSLATWCGSPRLPQVGPPLAAPKGSLRVILQDDDAWRLRRFSPWFISNHRWVSHLSLIFGELFVVPCSVDPPTTRQLDVIASLPGVTIGWPRGAGKPAATAVITSPDGMRVVVEHGVLLCFGHAPYRHKGVSLCLDDRIKPLVELHRQILSGSPLPLRVGTQRKLVDEYQKQHVRLAQAGDAVLKWRRRSRGRAQLVKRKELVHV